jgi:hypothetical protein
MPELLNESTALITSRFNAHLTFNVLNALINGRTESTLGEELNVIQDYLAIEKIRFNNRLEVAIDVDSDLGSMIVPKSFLISFVENAVKHGIRLMDGHGWLSISGSFETGQPGKSSGNYAISIRNLAPLNGNGFGQNPGSVHGHELARGLADAFMEKTGRKITYSINQKDLGFDLIEVEALIHFS